MVLDTWRCGVTGSSPDDTKASPCRKANEHVKFVKTQTLPVDVSRLIDWILSSHCSATRKLLATDHVILNHGQVTWTTPELASPSPNDHTTPTGGRFSSQQISRASLLYMAGL
ncbi:hypothetical protein TNCV_4103301 [Trichonephila clavipes]|nr:hypothetical protein TNCV_4103301 [Trichonephila clavipes]